MENKENMENKETMENKNVAESGGNGSEKKVKKSRKGAVIAIIAAVVVVIAALLVWYSGIVGGISEAEAREIAYQQVPGSEADGGLISIYDEFDDMRKTYEVQLTYDNMLYEFQILARNGKIVNQEAEQIGTVQQPGQNGTSGATQGAGQAADIGIDQARAIALQNVSGAAEANITKAALDNEHGRLIYEIEIVYNNMEYDFEIEAATGNIISQSSESVHH